MQGMLSIASFTALTAFCWGVYGPMLKSGVELMTGGEVTHRMRAFMGVGIAYFILAVVLPIVWLSFRGEKGSWTVRGLWWSLIAGAGGALGALGLILALSFGGSPLYVMPLVFGGAPVINTFVTMYMNRSASEAGPKFFAGLILVLVGATTVLVSSFFGSAEPLSAWQLMKVMASIGLTAVCWGAYGPLLHKGQLAMLGSRLRPLLCVGLAYLVIAVLGPWIHLTRFPDAGAFTPWGFVWSVAAGAVGAIGAWGLILAFNAGGKPIYVMPLVFGAAPVINTLVTLWQRNAFGKVGSFFYAGLIVVIAGATAVLYFAPRGHAPPKTP